MRYMLLIYSTEAREEFDRLPRRSRTRSSASTWRFGPARRDRGRSAPAHRHRDHRARGGRRDAHHRRAVRRDQGGPRRLLHRRGRRPRPRPRARRADPRGPAWAARRGPAGGRSAGAECSSDVFREERARVLATLIGFLGDFDLAEDAAQEAFALAARPVAARREPRNPRAWLVTTARNRAIDRIRRDRTLAEKTEARASVRELPVDDDDRRRRSRTSGSS